MLEYLKCIALSIAVLGFWLSILVPCFLHIKTFYKHNTLKVLSVLSVIISVLYFTILFYFIWIHNGFI